MLNVVGSAALLDAVRRCWASLWTDRAISYRGRQAVDQQTVKLAVVIQRMVPADVAGVLFTANPVTGARDEIVVDASPGLGEAIVSGQVTPDHFVLRRRWRGWSIVERRAGRREVVIRPRAAGGTEQVSPGTAAAAGPALPDPVVRQLARLGRAIERHFGAPQDIEWAWAGGELFVVQARPITALPPPAARRGRAEQFGPRLFAEMAPSRPYPIDQTAWVRSLFGAIEPIFELVGVTPPPIDKMFVEEDGVVVRHRGGPAVWPTVGILLAPFRLLRLALRYNPVRWQADPLVSQVEPRAHTLEARDLRGLSWKGLLATIRAAGAIPRDVAGELRVRYFPRAALAAGALYLVLRLLGRRDRLAVLLSGVETKTLEANRALEALAARIRHDPALAETFARHDAAALWAALEAQPAGRAFLVDLRTFLDRYGHREGAALLVTQPAWKDAPEVVLGILESLAMSEPRAHTGRPAWETARDDLLAHPLLRFPPPRSAFVALLTQARCLLQIREDTHFYATLPLPIIRRALLELGGRLADVGAIDVPEDVFHLKLGELEQIDGPWPPPPHVVQQARALVLRRKDRRAALEGTPLFDLQLNQPSELEGDALLRGSPGSPGIAEGRVRIVHDGSEFGKLRPGEVLVAPFTNPAWTPLFERAAAVVVDSGGAGSHAAIVAREYGIPAVMGTVDGTRRLVDGQWVGVDGTRGLVVEARPPAEGRDGRRDPPNQDPPIEIGV